MIRIEEPTDIIITDPCYFLPDDVDRDATLRDLGFTDYICEGTGVGDWSCKTLEDPSGKVLGDFCADSGMVAVVKLSEVLKINPGFNYHTERSWTTTFLPGFCGEIEDTYHDEGSWWWLEIKGKGNINFKTTLE